MTETAVLTSGGMDSAMLLADVAEEGPAHPLYVRAGLAWEQEEKLALEAFISAIAHPNVASLTVLLSPIAEVYGRHWSVSGEGAPAAGSPEESLFLPGRNILLLGLAAVWCSVRGIRRVAIGTLAANEFPDAQPGFFAAYANVLSQGLGTPIEVLAPYAGQRKAGLIRTHAHLPLALTLTCAEPRNGKHCGICMKCEERRLAFREAGIVDPTSYAVF